MQKALLLVDDDNDRAFGLAQILVAAGWEVYALDEIVKHLAAGGTGIASVFGPGTEDEEDLPGMLGAFNLVVLDLDRFDPKNGMKGVDFVKLKVLFGGIERMKEVITLVDPQDYDWVADALSKGELQEDLRVRLIKKVFRRLLSYGHQVYDWIGKRHDNFQSIFDSPGRGY